MDLALSMRPAGYAILKVDDENAAETFWDALRACPDLAWIEETLDDAGEVAVDEPTLHALEALDGWDDGPDYAPTALVVERLDGSALHTTASPLAIARMTSLARSHQHGWAQGFDRYNPPSMMAQVLAAYDAAQAADEQHRIVIPSLTHATGSGRTTWQIADDGTVTARIFEIQPGGEEWGDYDLVERAALTVAPDGTHTLTQLDGCDIDDLDRACRVWRAVRDVILRPEPTELDFSPEIVHCTPRTPAEEVMIVIER